MKRAGFTLFELLGVLTLIGVVLAVLLGSYGSWGTVHAVDDSTRILEAGLQQARTLARTRNEFIVFKYGSEATNAVQTISFFQIYNCTNDHADVSSDLSTPLPKGTPPLTKSQIDILLEGLKATRITPYQRLSGYIRLAYLLEEETKENETNLAVLIFRPDGSVWSASDTRCHILHVHSKEFFAIGKTKRVPTDDPKQLTRTLRIDLATGLVIKEESQP